VAGKIVLVQALHDRNDRARLLVIKSLSCQSAYQRMASVSAWTTRAGRRRRAHGWPPREGREAV